MREKCAAANQRLVTAYNGMMLEEGECLLPPRLADKRRANICLNQIAVHLGPPERIAVNLPRAVVSQHVQVQFGHVYALLAARLH